MQHVPGFNLASRRHFLESAGLGFGSVALAGLLHSEGLLADASAPNNPLAPTHSHFQPKAKAVIWLFQTGSPSQVDTFDYKPDLYPHYVKTIKVKTFGRGGRKSQ